MIKRLFERLNNPNPDEGITIVSGLPRSGTSMMMSMLEAGGMDILTDQIRTPDEDNPRGYYEYERVKNLKEGDFEWIPDAHGKVVKIIAALLPYLPDTQTYRIIFLRRALPEILASQRKMLINRSEEIAPVDDKTMTRIYEKHLKQIENWLENHANLKYLHINYNELIIDPDTYISQINNFLGGNLDVEQMRRVIDPNLYRQRISK